MNRNAPQNILIAGSILVLALWVAYALTVLGHPLEKWGAFGDKFGALSCLFTGLALVGLVAGFWHEREQAAGRDKEQRELLGAMRSQNKAIVHSARINALTALLNRATEKRSKFIVAGAISVKVENMRKELDDRIRLLESSLDKASEITELF